MGVHDRLGNGETETGTALGAAAGIVKSDEPLEYSVPVGRGYPWAVVSDDQLDSPVDLAHLDPNSSVGVTCGIVDQIAHHLGHAPAIGHHR